MYDGALKRVTLEVLATYLQDEKDRDSLCPLSHNFYELFNVYYEKLNQDFMEAPNYGERCMLDDERRSAKILYESLVEKRLAKIIGYSLLNISPRDATPSELDCWNQLTTVIRGYKDAHLGIVHGS